MFCVEIGRVYRLLQVEAEMDVGQEEIQGPLVLLVPAWGTEGQVRLAITQRQRRSEGGRGLFPPASELGRPP